jgi:hypothetical protein
MNSSRISVPPDHLRLLGWVLAPKCIGFTAWRQPAGSTSRPATAIIGGTWAARSLGRWMRRGFAGSLDRGLVGARVETTPGPADFRHFTYRIDS